jgi:hypothetical protein
MCVNLKKLPVDLIAGFIEAIAESIESPHTEQFRAFIVEDFHNPQLEPFIQNAGVYSHVSGRPVGPEGGSARSVYFEKKILLPRSAYAFFESAKVGTDGIRTDITPMTLSYYETLVLRSLDKMQPPNSPPPQPEKGFCGPVLSEREKLLLKRMRSQPAGKEPSS